MLDRKNAFDYRAGRRGRLRITVMIAGGKAARTLTSKARHGAVLMRIDGEARAESRAGPSVRRCSPACSSRRTSSRSPTLLMWVFTTASAWSGSSERSCSSSTSRSERAREDLWKAISASMVAKENALVGGEPQVLKSRLDVRQVRPPNTAFCDRQTHRESLENRAQTDYLPHQLRRHGRHARAADASPPSSCPAGPARPRAP